ncbi:hypothetical protein DXH95_08560 [Sphingorhabdus pulchriflava]|uniref:Uncharacterized protein n=1 Tax=Sphingorhabdus pulchriflava TaxID=2292257 RepID=A0A371BIN2_9SPHN|nr:hypothetical protein [Sphingorhabdus pulchriflava]RDV07387.1 hypothetical protein DXH95_08560 [Sphingorhabdus pulchriflava]
MKRSKKHIWTGLGFVATAIITAAMIYFGMMIASTSDNRKDQFAVAKNAKISANSLRHERPVTTSNEKEVEPELELPTKEWLVGSWRSADPDENPMLVASCDTDNIITFEPSGKYRMDGSYGNYDLNGLTLTYGNNVHVDYEMPEGEQEDYSEYDQRITATIDRQAPNVLLHDGNRMVRCTSQ